MLLVEDARADQLMLCRALAREPQARWRVEVKESGEEALAWLEAGGEAEVWLMDLRLPGMDGLELLRALRAQRAGPWPAVVMLTGKGDEGVAVEAMKLGAQDYLVKNGLSAERLRHSLWGAVAAARMLEETEQRRRQVLRAERKAREALLVRDELFSLATHDLRGPLQGVQLGLASLCRHLPRELLTGEVGARLEQVTHAARRMGVLIQHFLESSRAGVEGFERQRVDLEQLTREKVEELRVLAPEHPVRLEVEGGDFTGWWDRGALERVVDNLLSNAVKYSPGGGPLRVGLVEEEPGGLLRWEVEDQGVGISPEELGRIFERFQRGSNVREGMEGSGVGLASALRLVRWHGGELTVRSERGRGSTFTVRLPRGRRPEREGETARPVTDEPP